MKKGWGCGSGRELKKRHQDICAESLSYTEDTINSWEHTPPLGINLGEFNSPTRWSPHLPKNQLSGWGCRGLDRLWGYQWLSCMALWWGSLLPLSHGPDWHLTLTRDLLAPLSRLPAAQPSWFLVAPLCKGWAEYGTDWEVWLRSLPPLIN